MRRLVILAAMAAALLSGAAVAEAARYHRGAHWCEADYLTPYQVTCKGLSYCPRGYLTRCSPFRCWCVTT